MFDDRRRSLRGDSAMNGLGGRYFGSRRSSSVEKATTELAVLSNGSNTAFGSILGSGGGVLGVPNTSVLAGDDSWEAQVGSVVADERIHVVGDDKRTSSCSMDVSKR